MNCSFPLEVLDVIPVAALCSAAARRSTEKMRMAIGDCKMINDERASYLQHGIYPRAKCDDFVKRRPVKGNAGISSPVDAQARQLHRRAERVIVGLLAV